MNSTLQHTAKSRKRFYCKQIVSCTYKREGRTKQVPFTCRNPNEEDGLKSAIVKSVPHTTVNPSPKLQIQPFTLRRKKTEENEKVLLQANYQMHIQGGTDEHLPSPAELPTRTKISTYPSICHRTALQCK